MHSLNFNHVCRSGNISETLQPNPEPRELTCPWCGKLTDDGDYCQECIIAKQEYLRERKEENE